MVHVLRYLAPSADQTRDQVGRTVAAGSRSLSLTFQRGTGRAVGDDVLTPEMLVFACGFGARAALRLGGPRENIAPSPQRTLGTRLGRQKRGNLCFSARKKPASPTFVPLGQLPMWFLGRYLAGGFVLLPGLPGPF